MFEILRRIELQGCRSLSCKISIMKHICRHSVVARQPLVAFSFDSTDRSEIVLVQFKRI